MHWRILPTIPVDSQENLTNYSGIISQLLFNRGITDPKVADTYFLGGHGSLNDYNLIPGIAKAAEAVIAAVISQERIFIYGDYDADGVSATSILFDFLYRSLGANVRPYIPSRFSEGYGMGKAGLDQIIREEGKLVITVDCGIRDRKLVSEYVKKDLKFIITDHHSLPEDGKLPDDAVSIVHPSFPGSKYPEPNICGTAVAWKLVQKIAELAFEKGLISKRLALDEYLDLVALATITDIMPLQGENRVIVKLGLKKINNSPNAGLKELINISGLSGKEIESYHLGFVIGPKINAGGRIDHALDAVRLLTSRKPEQLFEISAKLNRLNTERQHMTEEMLTQAESGLNITMTSRLIFVSGEDWPEGVIGLVAGKLTEKYHLPTIAVSISKEGIAKGSARSIKGFNITTAIGASADILVKYGGHAQAAGFTVEAKNLTQLQESLEEIAGNELKAEHLQRELVIDKVLKLDEIDLETVKEISMFEPFGMGNPQPVFAFEGVTIKNIKLLGAERTHVKLDLLQNGNAIEAIAFNMAAEFSKVATGDKIDIAGNLSADEWNGRERIQLKVRDFKNA